MFFTRIGKVIAYIMVWGSLLGFVGWCLAVFGEMRTEDGQIYPRNPGKQLEDLLEFFFVGVVLGVLCEISSKKNKPDEIEQQAQKQ